MSGWTRGYCPENLEGYHFIIRGESEEGERPLSSSFLSRHRASIISSSSKLGWGFSCLYMVKPEVSWHSGRIISGFSMMRIFTLKMSLFHNFLSVQRAYPRVINSLSSLGRMWSRGHHCFVVLGHVSRFCCTIFLLLHACCFMVKQTCFFE